jgi:hypothetical protein
MEARMEALTTHLSDLGVVSLSVTRYSSAFSSLASALAVLRFFSAAAARSNRSVRRVSGPALAKRYRAPARIGCAFRGPPPRAVLHHSPPARVRLGLPLLSSLAKLRAFTSPLDPEKTIDIRHNRAQVGSKVYPNVEMKDILVELTRRLTKRNGK